MNYPEGVWKKKSDLLRPFNPLLEKGVEHRLYISDEDSDSDLPSSRAESPEGLMLPSERLALHGQ